MEAYTDKETTITVVEYLADDDLHMAVRGRAATVFDQSSRPEGHLESNDAF